MECDVVWVGELRDSQSWEARLGLYPELLEVLDDARDDALFGGVDVCDGYSRGGVPDAVDEGEGLQGEVLCPGGGQGPHFELCGVVHLVCDEVLVGVLHHEVVPVVCDVE